MTSQGESVGLQTKAGAVRPRYVRGMAKQAALWKTMGRSGLRGLSLRSLLGMRKFLGDDKLVAHDGQYVINSFLPPFPGPAFGSLARGLRSIRRGVAVPVSAYLSVTDACRYRCWHCSKARRGGDDLSLDTLLRVVREVQDLGVAIVGFTGGEPLLRDGLDRLVEAVDERSSTVLFTTGDGLDFLRARTLKEHGLFSVAISLDDYRNAEHDRGRGHPGAFETAVGAVRAAREAGLYTMTQIVATHERCRAGWLEHYLDFVGGLGVQEVRLLEPMPCGKLLDGDGGWLLSDEERSRLRELHLDTNRHPHRPKVSAFAQVEDVTRYGCGAGFQHLYVDAAGNVCPCDFTPVSFGNVRDESVEAIWRRLNRAFKRPRAGCFLMENAKALALAEADRGHVPLAYEEVKDACAFCETGELPAFYRALGWRRPSRRRAASVKAREQNKGLLLSRYRPARGSAAGG